jgi:mannose-6-phosphate isomerase
VLVQPARVHRFYRGGALLGRLRGEPEEDGFFPEDWLGSVTPARNPGRNDAEEGISRLVDGRSLLAAVEADPIGWLGGAHVARYGTSTGVLAKLLDAAERLPVHAHPGRAFARDAFGSPFGKTEAWYVLDTRADEAEVWVGLREAVEAERYRRWIVDQDVERLLGSLNVISVRAGDVVYVPAGVPHAIGAGVLIAELQEPTDFSFLCEWQGFPVRPEDSHLGLGWETALAAFDLGRHEPIRRLPEAARQFFWADDVLQPAGRFAILLVVAGEGVLAGTPARAGDAFAVPAAARALDAEGELRVLRFLAPDPA